MQGIWQEWWIIVYSLYSVLFCVTIAIVVHCTVQSAVLACRYCHNGQPLYAGTDTSNTVLPRCRCGAQRTFELQLMPALVHMLRRPQQSGCLLIFVSFFLHQWGCVFYPACIRLSATSHKNYWWIFMKILPKLYLWTRKNWLHFGRHQRVDLDVDIF